MYGSVVNSIMGSHPKPEVGMGVTFLYWSGLRIAVGHRDCYTDPTF